MIRERVIGVSVLVRERVWIGMSETEDSETGELDEKGVDGRKGKVNGDMIGKVSGDQRVGARRQRL